jgi:small subunit ribosomal protein S2
MEKEKQTEFKSDINLEEMAGLGLHFGHKTSRVHPKMKPYIYGTRNTVHIIDLTQTAVKLQEALDFIKKLISEDKVLLLVGTKIQFKNLIKDIAIKSNLPYVNQRWLGGTITNFEIIKKRIEYFKELERKKKDRELEKYTKKERSELDKELKDLEVKFGGIKRLEKAPDAILVLDIKKDILAIREARKKGIKIIAIADTNVDPTLVNYPIPANDDAISSVKYILEKVKDTILKIKPINS